MPLASSSGVTTMLENGDMVPLLCRQCSLSIQWLQWVTMLKQLEEAAYSIVNLKEEIFPGYRNCQEHQV